MRFRLRAFGLHLLGSALALTLVLGGLWLGWYRWPGWYLAGAVHVAALVLVVDLILGPLMTLLIASPGKPRAELVRDIAIIVLVQLVALGYGAHTLWRGRPLYYTFSADRLEMVQAADLNDEQIGLARRLNPAFAPHWYSRPRWVWAPLPDNPDEAAKIVNSAIFGGNDVIDMPRYFKPWAKGLPSLVKQLKPLAGQKVYSQGEKRTLERRLRKRGIPPAQAQTLITWGHGRPLLAVYDRARERIVALVAPD